MRPSRASEALCTWLRGRSEKEPRNQTILAERLSRYLGRRIYQGTISSIARGMYNPGRDLIAAFHAELGINPQWWSEAAPKTAPLPVRSLHDSLALRAHPATNIFPMAADTELRELAADIRRNGLQSPIVVTSSGELEILDGRNRLLACKLAGVTPTYVFWQGPDPVSFVVSANLKRRHLDEDAQRALSDEIGRAHARAADAFDPAANPTPTLERTRARAAGDQKSNQGTRRDS